MIIVDADLIELTDSRGNTFEELNFLPYLNTEVKIKGTLTYRKLKILLQEYPILKHIYSDFNSFIEQYNYDEVLKVKDKINSYKKILIRNNFIVQKNNYTVNKQLKDIDGIEGIRTRIMTVDYKETPSIDFKMITNLILIDQKDKERATYLVDLNNIIDLPIEISNGDFCILEEKGIFKDGGLQEIEKSKLYTEIETQITFNELFMVLSETPDFNSIQNKKKKIRMKKEKENLKKILGIDDIYKDEDN